MNANELKIIMSQELRRRKPAALFTYLEKKHKVTKKEYGCLLLQLVDTEFKSSPNILADITTFLTKNNLLEAK